MIIDTFGPKCSWSKNVYLNFLSRSTEPASIMTMIKDTFGPKCPWSKNVYLTFYDVVTQTTISEFVALK